MSPAVTALAILLRGLLSFHVQVEGSTACLSDGAIAEELNQIAGGPPPADFAVRVSVGPDRFRVEMTDGAGSVIGDRDLPVDGTCGGQLRALGAVIATWLADTNLSVVPSVETVLPKSPASDLRPVTTVVQDLPVGREPSSTQLWVTAGVLASWSRSQIAPGAELAAGAHPRGWPIGARAALFGTTTRSQTLSAFDSRVASWWRLGLSLGPTAMFQPGAYRFESHLAMALARVSVQGSESTTGQALGVQLGGTAGIRVGRAVGFLTLWLGMEALWWLGAHEVIVVDEGTRGSLAAWEGYLSAGVGMNR